jgi:hypothetical protein
MLSYKPAFQISSPSPSLGSVWLMSEWKSNSRHDRRSVNPSWCRAPWTDFRSCKRSYGFVAVRHPLRWEDRSINWGHGHAVPRENWISLLDYIFVLILSKYGLNKLMFVRLEVHIGYWWEIQKERDHWEEQDVGGWTILKWILER